MAGNFLARSIEGDFAPIGDHVLGASVAEGEAEAHGHVGSVACELGEHVVTLRRAASRAHILRCGIIAIINDRSSHEYACGSLEVASLPHAADPASYEVGARKKLGRFEDKYRAFEVCGIRKSVCPRELVEHLEASTPCATAHARS